MAPFKPQLGPVLTGTTDLWKRVETYMGIALDLDNIGVNAYLHDADHLFLRRWYQAHQAGATENQVGRWITNARGTGWQQTEDGQEAIRRFLSYLEDKINYFCPDDVYFGGADGQEPVFGFWQVPEEAPSAPAFKWENTMATGLGRSMNLGNEVVAVCEKLDELENRTEAGSEERRRIMAAQQILQDGYADDVLLAQRPEETITESLEREARAWLIDCFPDEEQDIRDASLELIQAKVDQHYDGGITAFTMATLGYRVTWAGVTIQ